MTSHPAKTAQVGLADEELFFELALEDLTRAAGSVPAGTPPYQRRRRLGIAGGLAAAGL